MEEDTLKLIIIEESYDCTLLVGNVCRISRCLKIKNDNYGKITLC